MLLLFTMLLLQNVVIASAQWNEKNLDFTLFFEKKFFRSLKAKGSIHSQQTFTCSKSTIETLLTVKTPERYY